MTNKSLLIIDMLLFHQLLKSGNLAGLFHDVGFMLCITINCDTYRVARYIHLATLKPSHSNQHTSRVIASIFESRQAIDQRVDNKASVMFRKVVAITDPRDLLDPNWTWQRVRIVLTQRFHTWLND